MLVRAGARKRNAPSARPGGGLLRAYVSGRTTALPLRSGRDVASTLTPCAIFALRASHWVLAWLPFRWTRIVRFHRAMPIHSASHSHNQLIFKLLRPTLHIVNYAPPTYFVDKIAFLAMRKCLIIGTLPPIFPQVGQFFAI